MSNQEEAWLLKEKYSGIESETFRADLSRLQSGEPLSYLIGHVPFLGCQIYLDSKPLIPRPETEYWVEKAIMKMKEPQGSLKVLDLCAGSGCIGVAVAKHVLNSTVDLVEIDEKHHSTISQNLKANGIEENRTKILGGSLFENVSGAYDFILSNPPYIDPSMDRTEESVKNHEPELALYGGLEGLDLIEKIITQAPGHLKPGGQLWLEHEPEQVRRITELANKLGFLGISTNRDQFGLLRYSVLVY